MSNSIFTRISSGGNIQRETELLPNEVYVELNEYKKLVGRYKNRFEQWPNAEMRETLYRQAITMVADADR